jgi:hypothetical protein
MVQQLLMTKPEQPVPHMLQILSDMQGTGKPPLSKEEKMELSNLREEYKKLKALKKKKGAESSDSEEEKDENEAKNDSSSCSEGEELDEMNDNMSPMKHQDKIQMAQKARTSVSAEVFGKYHVKAAFVPKVFPKNEETKAKIEKILRPAFMFMNLE